MGVGEWIAAGDPGALWFFAGWMFGMALCALISLIR